MKCLSFYDSTVQRFLVCEFVKVARQLPAGHESNQRSRQPMKRFMRWYPKYSQKGSRLWRSIFKEKLPFLQYIFPRISIPSSILNCYSSSLARSFRNDQCWTECWGLATGLANTTPGETGQLLTVVLIVITELYFWFLATVNVASGTAELIDYEWCLVFLQRNRRESDRHEYSRKSISAFHAQASALASRFNSRALFT